MQIDSIEQLHRFISKNYVALYGVGAVGKSIIEWAEVNQLSAHINALYDKTRTGVVYGYNIKDASDVVYEEHYLIISTREALAKQIKQELKLKKGSEVTLHDQLCDELLSFMDNRYLNKLCLQISDRLNKKIYWQNERERVFLLNNGWEILNSNIYKKYVGLISGLDNESVNNLTTIIYRIRQVINSNWKKIDLFTEIEQQNIIRNNRFYQNEIIEVAEDVYAFNKYFLPENHFETSVFLDKHGIELLTNHRKIEGTTIIDAGGFIGDSILVLEELKPKEIITFEAIEEHCNLINKTLQLNEITNVVVECKALGETEGEITMQVAGSGTNAIGRSGLEYEASISVPVVSLDDYCLKNHIEKIGLIKADIEGMESYMLKGGREIIKRDLPTLLISIYHNPTDFFEIKPMIESWDLGYRMKIHKPVTGGVVGETLLICEIP